MVVSKVPFFVSIATQLLRSAFGFYLFIAVAVTVAQVSAEYNFVKDTISEEITQLQKAFSPTFGVALWNLDQNAVTAGMEALGQMGIVAGVTLTDDSGTQVGAYGLTYGAGTSEKGELFASDSDLFYLDQNGNQILVGHLQLYFSSKSIFERIAHNLVLILINSLVKTLALWALFWFFTKKILAKPLTELADRVQTIELGQLPLEEIQIDTAPNNELKQVAESLNLMIEKINNSYTEVIKNNETLKLALKEAEAASEAKSNFLATMSHEIRTPMNGVLGMVQILRDTELNKSQTKFVDILAQSGSNLFAIISDILDFAKMEANQLQIEQRSFSLFELLESSLQGFYATAGEKNLELVCNLHSGICDELIGDPTRIRQIISNLLNNAIKFTGQGKVTLAVEQLEETTQISKLMFTISDTGIGIPEESRAQVFNNFVQVDGSPTRAYSGTGLGLSICKQLINLMNGEIEFSSVEGQGSQFWFILELQKETSIEKQPPQFPELVGKRVLIVGENQYNQVFMEEFFSSIGILYQSCNSAKEALDLAPKQNAQTFDLAIFDYLIPEMNGLDLTREFKKDPSLSQLPIILLTSIDHVKISKEAKLAGVDYCMGKPVLRSSTLLTLMVQCLFEKEQVNKDKGKREQPKAPKKTIQKQILIAEDDPANCEVLLEMLRPFQAGLHLAGNGVAALEILQNKSIDLILMDCHMPLLDGWEATAKIREMPKFQNTPIIAITADSYAANKDRCIAAGMNDFLPKPINLMDFNKKVEKWLYQSDQS